MDRSFRWRDRRVTVVVRREASDQFTVTVDGHPHAVHAAGLDPSTLQLVVDGTARTVSIARLGDVYHVAVDGEVYVLVPESPGTPAGHRAAALALPEIIAPMPGKILQVLVRVGQSVAAGDTVLILEAMKMEHRMVAEAPATVRALHVADGQMVDAGAVLAELDYGDDAAGPEPAA